MAFKSEIHQQKSEKSDFPCNSWIAAIVTRAFIVPAAVAWNHWMLQGDFGGELKEVQNSLKP